MAVAATRADFFAALCASCEGRLELRALPSKAQLFVATGDEAGVARFLAAHAAENLYFGVAPRRDETSGALENCQHLGVLFVDIDFKITPVAQARDAVRHFPLKPSIVVRSGGGVHLYWILREPMDLPEEAALAKDLLRRLARQLGGDLAAAEPARVLRVPGTRNFKYTPPRAVTLARLEAEARFNPSDFDSLLPAEPIESSGQRFTVPDRIRAGARNATLYALGRSLKTRGLTERELFAALAATNAERCEPPLGEAELRAVAHQAATQRDRSGFVDGPSRRRRNFTVEVWP